MYSYEGFAIPYIVFGKYKTQLFLILLFLIGSIFILALPFLIRIICFLLL